MSGTQRIGSPAICNNVPTVICRRKFPRGDPNDLVRPWLEEHIGQQAIDWNWEMCPNNSNLIDYHFVNTEDAVLFELSW